MKYSYTIMQLVAFIFACMEHFFFDTHLTPQDVSNGIFHPALVSLTPRHRTASGSHRDTVVT
jgi:hypothetical protein